MDKLNKRLSELSESGLTIINDPELQEKILKIRAQVEELIRKNPVASLGAGLLLGYLIGRLFRRD